MTNNVTVTEANDDLLGRLSRLVDALTLVDVRFVECVARSRFDSRPPPAVNVRIESAPPKYLTAKGLFANRFDLSFTFLTDSESEIATIEVGIVLEFSIKEDYELKVETASAFLEHNGFFIAYPYIREAVQSLSARLGLDPAIVGIMRRDEAGPTGITVTRRAH